MSHQWMILAIVPCMLANAAPAEAGTPFSKQVQAGAKGSIRVSNVSGDVTLTAWDRPLVDVQGDLGSGVERVDVNEDGGDVEIRVVLKNGNWQRRDGDARLTIRLPAGAELDASTVSGSIAVSGVRGEQRLKSVSGDVRSDLVDADVSATTVSGQVDLAGTGRAVHVRATSVSGAVRLRRIGGEIDARSTSGSVDIEAMNATDVRGGVVSGNLSLLGSLSREAEVELNAVSGRVKIAAQAPAGFRYDVTTFSGGISSCFGGEADSKDGGRRGSWGPGSRLGGERGEGKASIRARSHSGAVEICDR